MKSNGAAAVRRRHQYGGIPSDAIVIIHAVAYRVFLFAIISAIIYCDITRLPMCDTCYYYTAVLSHRAK